MPEEMFSTYQVADMLGTTPANVAEWMRKGWLPFIRLPDGPVRVSQAVLTHFLQRRGVDVDTVLAKAEFTDGDYEADVPPLQPPPEDENDLSAYLEQPPTAEGVLDQPSAEDELDPGPAPQATETPMADELPQQQEDDLPDTVEDSLPQEPPHGPEAEDIPGIDSLREAILKSARDQSSPPEPRQTAPTSDEPTRSATQTGPAAPPPYPAEPDEVDLTEDQPPGDEPGHVAPHPPMAEPIEEPAQERDEHPVDISAPPSDAAEQVARAILTDAITRGASHVHLWLEGEQLRLLWRMDGVLHETETFRRRLPGELTSGVLRAMRSLAGLPASRPEAPLRASFTFEADAQRVRARLVELPSESGSAMAIELRSLTSPTHTIATLGLSDAHEATLRSLLDSPAGLVVLVSPPGHRIADVRDAVIGHLVGSGRHAATPGPMRVAGVTQLPADDPLKWAGDVDADAIALRSLDDVDVAAVCESATGRLIVSHVTAGDAPEAIDALLAGGAGAGRLAGVLGGVFAVRSLGRLCLFCREQLSPSDADLTPLGPLAREVSFPVWRAVGCRECCRSGYRGTTHLAAPLVVTRAMAAEMRRNPDLRTLELAARAAGLASLHEDALRVLREGASTPTQLARALRSRPGETFA
ncbi:MAG: ATPase, T2SS/T4P/T4SS family [Phycisphaerae bacterium]